MAELPEGADDERPRALGVAAAAHRQLTAVLADGRFETMSALGGLTADTQRLLDDLTSVVSQRSGKPRRTAGRVP
ncbi:hypothetical protein ACFVXW_22155 [Streptomyces sp. NPDC058251]|uniref:hypothetical protein n=1 Tax=Streptomyces sp. NPDC058251 TaxID=3346404 RepID=UPI0036EDC58F